ncbi:MAG: molecular chaperone DnaJ [Sphingobium sp.]|nr:MAG: molecular chaperone DnaJ [Sphingobium sp.]
MGLLAILLIALAGWLMWTGRLQRMKAGDGVALGLAIVGTLLAAKGQPVLGALPLLGAVGYLLWRQRAPRPGQRASRRGKTPSPPPVDDAVAEASALLGIAADAGPEAIRAAHRRLIASVHPDRGGTEALAAKINAARDLLLRRHEYAKGSRHGVEPHSPD